MLCKLTGAKYTAKTAMYTGQDAMHGLYIVK